MFWILHGNINLIYISLGVLEAHIGSLLATLLQVFDNSVKFFE